MPFSVPPDNRKKHLGRGRLAQMLPASNQ